MKYCFIICVIFTSLSVIAQNDTSGNQTFVPGPPANNPPNGGTDDITNTLAPLLAYNFSGGNKKFSSLTPVVQYGWSKTMKGKWNLSINPYAAGQIEVNDSAAFLPGLMLPGVAGLKINNQLLFPALGGEIVWSPLNFGLKLMTNFIDSNQVLIQHNLRTGIGYRLREYFQFGVQYTLGWHNITSESESYFKSLFNTEKTKINYLTAVFETFLNKDANNSSVLYLEWRGVLGGSAYKNFPNSRILTIGFRKDLNLDNLAPAAPMAPGAPINF